MATAFWCTMGMVRSALDFNSLRYICNPPADREGLSYAIDQIPKRDRLCVVATLKSATGHGPGFLTGLNATKIVSAAPFRTQSIANSFLPHRGRAAPRSVFAMIDGGLDLSITRQAELLQISRGSVYYLPRPVPNADLAIMRRLDRLHLEFPFAGSRLLRGLLAAEGCKIGRRHVKTLMRRKGIEALYASSTHADSPWSLALSHASDTNQALASGVIVGSLPGRGRSSRATSGPSASARATQR